VPGIANRSGYPRSAVPRRLRATAEPSRPRHLSTEMDLGYRFSPCPRCCERGDIARIRTYAASSGDRQGAPGGIRIMGISERRSLSAARHGSNVAWARSALRWCAVAPLSLLLTACHWAVLDPRGPVGQADRTILIDSLAIMLAIGVPTI